MMNRGVMIAFCVMAAMVGLVAGDAAQFILGTHSGNHDVVANGIVQFPFNGTHQQVFQPNVWSLHFWAKSTDPVKGNMLHLSIIPQQTSPRLQVIVPNPEIDIGSGGSPQQWDIQFTCDQPNAGDVEAIYIDIKPSAGGVTFDTVTITFDKLCNYPLLNMGANDDATPGVISKSAVQTLALVATPDDHDMRFYVWVDTDNQFPEVLFSIASLDYDHTLLSIDQQLTLPNAGKLGPIGAEASDIWLGFTCANDQPLTTIDVSMTINVHWKLGRTRDMIVKFQKKCSSSYVKNPRPGLTVATTDTGHDIIADGVTTDNWDVTKKQIDYSVQFLNFYIGLNSDQLKMSPRSQRYNITTATHDRDAGGLPILKVHQWNTTGVVDALDSKLTHFALWVTCRVEGFSTTRVIITLDGRFDPISFYFTKRCAFPKLQVGLDIGGDHSEVIKDSIVQNNWNYIEKADTTSLYFWLPTGEPLVQLQPFRVHWYHYDRAILNGSTHFGRGHVARVLQLGTPEASINIDYKCRADAGGKSARVNVTIDIGWEQQFTVQWTKYCPVSASSSGWSAAGIFFFTVFMLTLVGCIAGCGYNRFGQNKRGFAIVPCNSYMTSCYEKVVAPKKYTPQTDYSYDAAEEKGNTTGYQTDL